MAHFHNDKYGNLSIYHGNKFIRYIGKEDKYTPLQLNYILKRYDKNEDK